MHKSVENGVYRKTTLDSGVRVVTEFMPHVQSLAIGYWFDTGSRDEPQELAGISHYLEHMNFKGTKRRSAAAIARQIEGRGGHLNAFTSKETTCFYARVIDEQLSVAVDVLSDITQHSIYEQIEVDRERGVILEELKNVEDTPDEMVFEHFIAQLYSGHPMEWPVIGRRDTLANINNPELTQYRHNRYNSSNALIAAAGRVDHKRLVRLVEKRMGTDSTNGNNRTSPKSVPNNSYRQDLKTNTQQAHICWGCRAFKYDDERKYALLVLNTLLGGGMSSRLFQNVREKHGLAYSVYSFMETYADTGLFGVYAGSEPKQAEKALRLIKKEVRDLIRRPISSRELNFNKDQLKGSILLGLESPTSRMHRMAKMELYTGKWITIDEVRTLIDSIDTTSIHTVARDIFENQPQFTTILWPK